VRRKLFWGMSAGVVLSVAYMASPVIAAYSIRQAAKTGDVATLEKMIEWDGVRTSLKRSLVELQTAPSTDSPDTIKGMPSPPSLWTRIKASFAPAMIDSFVDKYVSPTGLPQAFAMRETWRETVRPAVGLAAPKMALADTSFSDTGLDRFLSFYTRIKRASFLELGRVEFEIADRLTPERRYVTQFAIKDWGWKLTSVRVIGQPL
jgi:Protein of unknown function (DUF2939)